MVDQNWLAGYADAKDATHGQREPAGDPLAPDVEKYWAGWRAGIMDTTAATMRRLRREKG